MRFFAVYPGLYIRPHTKNVNTERMLHAIEDLGIREIFNVALINDEPLAAGCRTVGISYRHEPMHDAQNQDWEFVRKLGREVAQRVRDKVPVLVHCDSGWNRSSLIAVLAIVLATGRPAKDVISECRAIRGEDLLKNWAFEHFLLSEY